MMKILVPEKEKYRLHSRIERGNYNILAIDHDIASKGIRETGFICRVS